MPRRLGAEVEFIPVEAHTGRRCPIEDEGVTSTLPFLRRYGGRQGWVRPHLERHALFHAAFRRNADLRARRTDRVQLPAMRYGQYAR